MKKICSIFKSNKEDGMYLYVDKAEGTKRVPEPLLKRFGEPQLAMTLLIEPGRKLARADAQQVLKSIEEQGYYLQMPPGPAEYLQSNNS